MTILKEYIAIKKQYEDKRAEFGTKENIIKAVEELSQDHEGLDVVVFVGYTPGFNDGEPCTHSSYVLTEATGELFELLYPNQLAGIIGLEEQEEWDDWNDGDEPPFEINKVLVDRLDAETERYRAENDTRWGHGAEYNTLNNKLNIVDDDIESLYDTDYIVVVYRNKETGKFEIYQTDYDCGY